MVDLFEKIQPYAAELSLPELQVLEFRGLLKCPTLTKNDKIRLGPYHRGIIKRLVRLEENKIEQAAKDYMKDKLKLSAANLSDEEIDLAVQTMFDQRKGVFNGLLPA